MPRDAVSRFPHKTPLKITRGCHQAGLHTSSNNASFKKKILIWSFSASSQARTGCAVGRPTGCRGASCGYMPVSPLPFLRPSPDAGAVRRAGAG